MNNKNKYNILIVEDDRAAGKTIFYQLRDRGYQPHYFERAEEALVFFQQDIVDLVGIEGAENWDQAALFRYRSRRAFLEIVTNPAFRGKHHFKTVALDKTIAYPIETDLYLGDPRLLLGLILLAVTALIDSLVMSKNRGQTTVKN